MAEPIQPARPTADECRAHAGECRRMARLATAPHHCIVLEHIADTLDADLVGH